MRTQRPSLCIGESKVLLLQGIQGLDDLQHGAGICLAGVGGALLHILHNQDVGVSTTTVSSLQRGNF